MGSVKVALYGVLVRKEQVRMARVYKNNRYFFYGVTESKGF